MGGAKAGIGRFRQESKACTLFRIAQVARLGVIVAQDLRSDCLIFGQ
jgi:hypothetical protein